MLDKRDQQIIAHLRSNARKKVTEIAEETNIPATTIYDKMEEFQKTKIIKKHVCLLDFAKLGYPVTMYIAWKVDKDDKEMLQEHLLSRGMNSVYKVNFGYDFLVEGIFESLKEAEEFVEDVEKMFHIKERKILNIVEELRKEVFFCKLN